MARLRNTGEDASRTPSPHLEKILDAPLALFLLSSHLEESEHVVMEELAQLELLAGVQEGAGHLLPAVEGRVMTTRPVIHTIHTSILCKLGGNY